MKESTIRTIKKSRSQRYRRIVTVNILLSMSVCLLCFSMLLIGNTIYPVQDVFQVLMGEPINGVSFAVNTIRLPRMLAGFFSGIAFGMAGNTFQTMLRNPLANPDILGITTGSSVAALFCILFLQTNNTIVSISSIVAGLLTSAVIYILARGKLFSVGRLILVGIGIQAMLNAFVSYLLVIGNQQDIPAALRWLSGSLNGVQMNMVYSLILTVLICTPIVLLFGGHLRILELGEHSALSLGLNTNKTRIILILSSIAMTAVAVSVTGPIAFVSFLSGPIAKRLIGRGHSNALTAGLVGATLVLVADLVGQFAFSVRYPVGIITGILGAPYLLYLLISMNRKGNL